MKQASRSVTAESAGPRGGLLFPDGPTRRDFRPLMMLLAFAAGGVLVWFFTRRPPVPPPSISFASQPAIARTPVSTSAPAASAATGTADPPQTWEQLTASRAAALRAAAASEAPPEPPPAPAREAPAPRSRRERAESRRAAAPPPAAEPAAPTAAPAEAPGRLSVSTVPWGQLIVDGRPYGTTPRINLPIAVGQRRIRVARDGFEPFDTTITVESGASIRLAGITLRDQP